jgi:hypothetical protein
MSTVAGTRPAASGDQDASRVLGGALYSVVERLGLIHHDRRDPLRCAALVAAIAWLPSVVIAVYERFANGVWPSYVSAFDGHVRALIGLPLLFVAERAVFERIHATTHVLESGTLVERHDHDALVHRVDEFHHVCEARVADPILFLLAVATTVLAPPRDPASWAAVWDAYVATTLVRFIVYRWLWRWLAWGGFLSRISTLDLAITPTHPDRGGGLVILSQPSHALGAFVLAMSSTIAAQWATRVFLEDLDLDVVQRPALVLVVTALLLAVLPLLPFAPRLVKARQQALREYGTLARNASLAFRRRWIGDAARGEALLEANDPSSLIDLISTVEVVVNMRPIPCHPRLVPGIAACALAPFLPLVIAKIPAKVVFETLVKGF